MNTAEHCSIRIEGGRGKGTLWQRARAVERVWCRCDDTARRELDAARHREVRARHGDVLDHCDPDDRAFDRICYEAHGDDLHMVDVWWAEDAA